MSAVKQLTSKHDRFQERNRIHEANPEPGDYWHEHYSPYFVVLAYDKEKDEVVYCDTTIDHPSTLEFEFDVSKAKKTTREFLFKRVHYDSDGMRDKYIADNFTTHAAIAQDWIELGSPFQWIEPNDSETSLDKLIFLRPPVKGQHFW